MICNATYDSLDAIPDNPTINLREEFHQVNGKWVLKDTAVPGVGPLFNSALAANEAKAVTQVKTRNDRITVLENENNTLKDKLSVHEQPGTVALSGNDAKLWEKYTTLGTPKEIEAKLKSLEELETKVTKFETSEGLSKITEAVALNSEVLSDWATSAEGKGLTFFVKDVESTDDKGNKVTTKVPMVKIEETGTDGKITLQEKELLPFAKEKLPSWKYDALVTTTDDKGQKKVATTAAPAAQQRGVRLPDLGNATKPTSGGTEKPSPVERFNKERDSRPNPFAPKAVVNPALAGMNEQQK